MSYMGLCLPASSFAADMSLSWNVEDLANSSSEKIILRDTNNRILKRVDRSQMLYLYAVKKSIENAAEKDVPLLIISGDKPNAHAGMIQGKETVLVNFAMLDMIGKDMHQWAALIGHEIAHLKLGHQGKRIGLQIPLVIAQSIIQEKLGSEYNLITDLVSKSISTTYSRDNERESDYLGAIWAVEAGYDPTGAVNLHESMYKLSGKHPLPFLSSHPSGPERIRFLQSLANRLSR